MSQLGFIYDEYKKAGFQPLMLATALGENDDLSIFMHRFEVPECYWFHQWQKMNWHDRPAVNYWDPFPSMGGVWVLIP